MRISSFLLSRCAFSLSALQQYLMESYHAIEGISNVFIYHLKLFSLKFLGPHIFSHCFVQWFYENHVNL